MENDYFVSRLIADRRAELARVSTEVKLKTFITEFSGRPRVIAWTGLRLAALGAKLAGVKVDLPRTVRELQRLTCVEC